MAAPASSKRLLGSSRASLKAAHERDSTLRVEPNVATTSLNSGGQWHQDDLQEAAISTELAHHQRNLGGYAPIGVESRPRESNELGAIRRSDPRFGRASTGQLRRNAPPALRSSAYIEADQGTNVRFHCSGRRRQLQALVSRLRKKGR